MLRILAVLGFCGSVLAGQEEWEQLEPPSILFVQPNVLPADGKGHIVRVVGRNFYQTEKGRLRVRLGQTELTKVEVENEMRFRVKLTAPTVQGALSLVVETPGGRATLPRAIYFTRGFNAGVVRYKLALYVRKIWDFFLLGGPVMPFIGLCSILMIAWAIHCFFVLRYRRLLPRDVIEGLSARLADGDLDGASALCESRDCLLSRVMKPGLRSAQEGPEQVYESVQSAGTRETAHLRQKISWLYSIGYISPMLGLLGTVIGMVMSFNVIAWEGAKFVLLAAAIAQALTTTVFGLVVGIPAMVLYFYFRSKVLRISTGLEILSEEFSRMIAQRAS